MTRHFLEVDDVTPAELDRILLLAEDPSPPPVLAGRGVALLFEKPSNRTRNSTEMAVVQLGGHPVSIGQGEVGLDTRETAEDVARTLACFHAAVGARVFAQSVVERMAAALDDAAAGVPVFNLLSDDAHPCQALADLLTLRHHLGSLAGRTVAWVGDANNVARSLALGAVMCGMHVRLACPDGHRFDAATLDRVAAAGPGTVADLDSPADAVAGADAVSTDVWASMGQEAEVTARRQAFAGFTVDARLMAKAAPDAAFLHCLPAHRGEEVSDDVLDSPASLVWTQATNRMHSVRGLLLWLLGQAGA